MQARKRTREVWACQCLPENKTVLHEKLRLDLRATYDYLPGNNRFRIWRENGYLRLNMTDWLVVDPTGKFFIVPDRAFRPHYLPVEETDRVYRKDGYLIDFIKFPNLTDASIKQALEFLRVESHFLTDPTSYYSEIRERGHLVVKGLTGNELLYPGNFLIKGPQGTYGAIGPKIFRELYEIVEN